MADMPIGEMVERLRRPFPTSSISWRVGSTAERDGKVFGLPLAYIDARDVMDRLDDVVNPENWQDRYTISGQKTICAIGIRVDSFNGGMATDTWVWKEDGAGDTDFEAEKGALSDAFKRAAVRWGIGRYLYGLKSGWVEVEKRGKSTIIPDAARKELDAAHDKAIASLEWGDREERNIYRLLLVALAQIDPHELAAFETENEGVMAQLPVAMRANLIEKIKHIHQANEAKAMLRAG